MPADVDGQKRETYLCAVLQLKLVEEGPGVSQVWLDLHGPQEPLSGFGDLTLAPEQPEMHKQDCISEEVSRLKIYGQSKSYSMCSKQVLQKGQKRKLDVVLGYSEQDVGVVFALLQSVDTLGLPLGPGLQKHGLGPQDAWEECGERGV